MSSISPRKRKRGNNNNERRYNRRGRMNEKTYHEKEGEYGEYGEYDDEYDEYDEYDNNKYAEYSYNEDLKDNETGCVSEEYNEWNGGKICKFWNPYFRSGCQYGRYCQFSHLSQAEFLKYCRYFERICRVDLFASNIFEKSLKYIKQNKIKNAYLILKKLVSDYELNGLFNFWLGRCHHLYPNTTNEDMNTAQYYYRKAIAISPDNASFHSHYAQFSVEWAKKLKLKVRCSEYKQAKDHFLKSLEIRKTPMVHFMFAKFLDEIENQYFDAQYHYKQALNVFTNDTRLRLNYARLLGKMKKYKLAKKQFLSIFKILKERERSGFHQNQLWPHFHFAKLLIEMELYQQSKQEFILCCNIMDKHNNKYFSEIYYEFAKLLFCYLNDYDSAYYYIDIAIQLSPSRRYYKKLLYQIENNWDQQQQHQQQQQQQPPQQQQKIGFDFGYNNNNNNDDDAYYDNDYDQDGPTNDDETKTEGTTPKEITNQIGAFSFGTTANNKHLNDDNDDDQENEFLANRFCATEFDRFISSDSSFGDEFEKYCDKFEDEKMNDIRWLLNEKVLKDDFLRNKIGMNQNSINIWKKSVNTFNHQYNHYIQWLKKNNFYDKYFKKIQNYGILHLQSFFYHIKDYDDILYMIGKENIYKNDAIKIWISAEKEMNQIIKSSQQI